MKSMLYTPATEMKTVTRPLLCATGTGASVVSKALMATGKMPLLDHVPINHRHGHKWPHVSLATDTAYATAFGRVTDDTATEPCHAVSVSLQLIQHDTARCSDTALQQLQDTARYTPPQ